MELVALDLKLRGTYLARQLGFKGVSFNIVDVPFDFKFQRTYDESVKLVCRNIYSFFNVDINWIFFYSSG